MRIISYLDCGCAIREDGSRAVCPSCESNAGATGELYDQIEKLKTDWIEIALATGNRREMIVSWVPSQKQYSARMEFTDIDEVIVGLGLTLPEAITNLNEMLLEDAADEMRRNGTA